MVSLDTILTWEATTDPDPFDIPHYDLWLATEPDFSDAVLVEDSTAYNSTFLEDLQNYMVYYWTVRATDRNTPVPGLRTPSIFRPSSIHRPQISHSWHPWIGQRSGMDRIQ